MEIKDNINKPSFDKYVEELYKINTENPKRAEQIAKQGLEELGLESSVKTSPLLGIDMEWAGVVIVCILIALCGFLVPDIKQIALYFFGMIFFFAGLFVGLTVPVFGLIFLVTHGGTGLFMMISTMFGEFTGDITEVETVFNNPAFTDGGMPNNIKLYLGITKAIFITALIYSILHNLSPRLKENKKHMIIILTLYLLFILSYIYFYRPDY